MLLRPRQKLFVERSLRALDQHGNALGVAPTGCHAPGTPILMYDGSLKPVEDIAVGDVLMGPGSAQRQVLELHRGTDEMVEVRPIKGMPFTVNKGHILTLVRVNEGKASRKSTANSLIDIPVREVMEASATFRHLHKLVRLPADFPECETPILEPYMLGVLIGDGSLIGVPAVTTPDAEIAEAIFEFASEMGLIVRTEQIPHNEANTYHLTNGQTGLNPLNELLRSMGLWGKHSRDKFLPGAYKFGSPDTRLQILAGLLDTDGHHQRGGLEWVSASGQLAEDVAFLCRSLGFAASHSEKCVKGKVYHRLHISGQCERIPTRVVRKQAAPRKQKKDVLRTGFTLHPVGTGEYFGFSVDGDHRYLMGDFTLTHNSGKTIMLSAVAGNMVGDSGAKACVLTHRDELTAQNRGKFARVNPGLSTSVVDARQKSWAGQVTFAMVPTLTRAANLDALPALDLLVVDEAHHAAADSYRRIIDKALDRNPDCRIFGVTATPNRGDKKGLRPVFSNVSDQIRIGELIAAGHLVPPRTFVVDVGVQNDLGRVRKTVADFDMGEVDAIMNRAPVTDAVIEHWREKAGDRQTVVFCSTVDHARNVADAFNAAGVTTGLIYGDMGGSERKAVLANYGTGKLRVVVNVAVLTEGWDHPPTSCVVLLRPSSYKSTMMQMVGRGLRIVDPEEHPGVLKTDCIVLDFGTSTLLHGSLEQDVDLDGREGSGEVPTKECPDCEATVPLAVMECPLCGHLWERDEADGASELSEFVMSEIDLLKRSSFRWCDLFGDDAALIANGFVAWGGVFFLNGRWHGIGGRQKEQPKLLAVGERTVCLAAADDWLNTHESDESAHKTRRWLNQPPTQKQLQYLPADYRQDFGLTRYQASALLSFRFNRNAIRALVFGADNSANEIGRAA